MELELVVLDDVDEELVELEVVELELVVELDVLELDVVELDELDELLAPASLIAVTTVA